MSPPRNGQLRAGTRPQHSGLNPFPRLGRRQPVSLALDHFDPFSPRIRPHRASFQDHPGLEMDWKLYTFTKHLGYKLWDICPRVRPFVAINSTKALCGSSCVRFRICASCASPGPSWSGNHRRDFSERSAAKTSPGGRVRDAAGGHNGTPELSRHAPATLCWPSSGEVSRAPHHACCSWRNSRSSRAMSWRCCGSRLKMEPSHRPPT
jgi:hypothetical protein